MKKRLALIVIWSIVVLFNVIAWISTPFADFLRKNVMKVTGGMLGRFSSMFPFSLGEILLVIAVLMVLGLAADGMMALIFRIKRLSSSKEKTAKAGKTYAKVVIWTFSVVALLMTFHCFPLYHASSFGKMYLSSARDTYPPEELILLREHIIKKADELSEKMPRQENGLLAVKDTRHDAIKAMQRLGGEYPILSGYYPVPKELFCSGFFSQQYIMGYYFPFSMEANYNGVMYVSNVPYTQCHELSHTKGFMYEDDANFIGYLACISSGDEYLEYSGYLGVLGYLNDDLYDYLGRSREAYLKQLQPNAKVKQDLVFLTKEAWEQVEEKAVLDTETVHQASDAFLETNLKVNGVEQGTFSYRQVVQRLLEYYESHPLP